jgi:hypothetical protein
MTSNCRKCVWYKPVESDTHVVNLCEAHVVTTSGFDGLTTVERTCEEINARGTCLNFTEDTWFRSWWRYPGNKELAVAIAICIIGVLVIFS